MDFKEIIIDKIKKNWAALKETDRYKKMSSAQKYLVVFCLIVLFLAVIKMVFGLGANKVVEKPVKNEVSAQENKISSPAAPNAQEKKTFKWPYYTTQIRSWSDPEFDDLNDVQLEVAMKNGLSNPIPNREEAEKLVSKGELVYVGISPFYYAEEQKHSIPYLIPKAHRLLSRICVNFQDSLQSKKLPMFLPVLTSVLRTEEDVSKLKRNNVNASSNSCHRYATTFDLSWRSFVKLGENTPDMNLSADLQIALKRTLGEVLRDLRFEGRCFVKHERKQPCFHVTVR